MIVRLQNKGRAVTGLSIGSSNVRRYFPWGLEAIDLELDHLRIQCQLQTTFWDGRPELTDPRLCAWLEAKCSHERLPRTPVSLKMVQTDGYYRLQLIRSTAAPQAH